MNCLGLSPILNVSDFDTSLAWFARLGLSKLWSWGDPPTFGAVGFDGIEIFLCLDGQGGRGRNGGMWMSVWVENVDAVHERCLEHGIDVTRPPTDEPWHVREMHVRHPDGHVLRISQGLACEDSEPSAPLAIERVDVPVRLESRLAAVLKDLAAHKGMSVDACLEETLLHTFERVGGGVASPHTRETLKHIESLKRKHGLEYGPHDSDRFSESTSR